jgi:hypothetical protein
MNPTRLTLAVALTLAGIDASAANLGAVDLSSGSAAFSNTPVAGAFTDTLTFTLTTASTFNGSVTSVLNGSQDVDFTSISLSGPGGVFAFTGLLGDPVELWAVPAGGFALSAGLYTLTLTGTNSAAMGTYAGNLAVSPVPEPATYALLAAGLLGVGVTLRRRGQQGR